MNLTTLCIFLSITLFVLKMAGIIAIGYFLIFLPLLICASVITFLGIVAVLFAMWR